jgi:hypothetical protein
VARVNVEQKALSDPRFDLLARLMKSDERDLALGRMVRVWNECIERGTYALPTWVIQTLFDDTEAPDWLVSCDLAERVGSDVVRIKGTEGRVEYLEAKRATARRNGKLGGRPKSNQSITNVGSSGFPKKSSPAPAPAPAPAPNTPLTPLSGGTDETVAIPPELSTEEFRIAWGEWKAERVAKRHKPYTPKGEREQLRKLAVFGPEVAIAAIRESIAQGWQGVFPEKVKQHGQQARPGSGVRSSARIECEEGRYGRKPAIVAGGNATSPGQTAPGCAPE